MKKVLALLLLICFLAGCSVALRNESPEGLSTDNPAAFPGETGVGVMDKSDTKSAEAVWDTNDFTFPMPDTDRLVTETYGEIRTFYCYGMEPDDLSRYIGMLRDDGWFLVCTYPDVSENPYDPTFILTYEFVKGNQLIHITNQTFVDDAGGNYIYLSHIPGYAGVKRPEGITKEDALLLIQLELEKTADEYERGKKVSVLVELDMPEAFEKAQMQVFYAYGDNTHFGQFIVSNGTALRVFGALAHVNVIDIDNDGIFELISMYKFGSGIERYAIAVYKYCVPPGSNTLNEELHVAYSNVWQIERPVSLDFVVVSDTQIKLVEVRRSDDGGQIILEDFGILKLDGSKVMLSTTADSIPLTEDVFSGIIAGYTS